MNRIIVNEKDEIIGFKQNYEETVDDIGRVSGLWIYNSKNEILIAQRSLAKKYSPGLWGPAVSGTVEEGETYESNIIKETKEELGLTISEDQIQPGSYGFVKTSHSYFRKIFTVKLDIPIDQFTIQQEEVEQIKWIPFEELVAWYGQSPEQFVTSFPSLLEKHKNNIMKKLWFRRKAYGWGWYPATWQGWVTILVFGFLDIALAFRLPKHADANTLIFEFIIPIICLALIVIFICYKTGESPRWQWGEPKDKIK